MMFINVLVAFKRERTNGSFLKHFYYRKKYNETEFKVISLEQK